MVGRREEIIQVVKEFQSLVASSDNLCVFVVIVSQLFLVNFYVSGSVLEVLNQFKYAVLVEVDRKLYFFLILRIVNSGETEVD